MSENTDQIEYYSPIQFFFFSNYFPPSFISIVNIVALEVKIFSVRCVNGLRNGLFYLEAYVLTRFHGSFAFNIFGLAERFSEKYYKYFWKLMYRVDIIDSEIDISDLSTLLPRSSLRVLNRQVPIYAYNKFLFSGCQNYYCIIIQSIGTFPEFQICNTGIRKIITEWFGCTFLVLLLVSYMTLLLLIFIFS